MFRLGVVLASLVAASVGVLASCGSFGASSDGAGSEGGVEDGASTVDATITDGGRTCNPADCRNFDDGQLPGGWSVNGDGGGLTVSPGAATSGGFALDLVLKNDLSFLAVDVGGASKVSVTANVLVVQFGDGEVDLLGIAELANTGVSGLYLIHPPASGASLSIELPKNEDHFPVAATFMTYTPVTLEIDFIRKKYFYSVGGVPKSGDINMPFAATTAAVLIGGQYSMNVNTPWHVRYDDIQIVVER